jgi:hypothetical protein
MFADVSYDNQDYYYVEKGTKLKEKFDAASDFGDKMWVMELAASKLAASGEEFPYFKDLHDIVFDAAANEDLAKRTGFKPLFVKHMLYGETKLYKQYLEEFEDELRELDRFDRYANWTVWQNIITRNDFRPWSNGYYEFSGEFHKKLLGLQLHDEMVCIAECRTLLSSYDDFILGLRINQELYRGLENAFKSKVSALQSAYTNEINRLHAAAASQGLLLNLDADVKLLESKFRIESSSGDFVYAHFKSEQTGE